MDRKSRLVLTALLLTQVSSHAQTAAVDAGQLLEQQRRLEQQAQPAPRLNKPLRDASVASQHGKAGDTQVSVRRFKLSGHTLLDDATLQAVLRAWLMRPLTLFELRQAAVAVEQAYRDAGWLAHASLPAQDLTDGQLRIDITEARLGQVRMAPATSGSAAELSPRLTSRVQAMLDAQLGAGQPLNLLALERALLIADELPGAVVGGSLQGGAQPGTTDLLVQVAPAPRLQGDISIDNAANRSTGSERVNGSLRLNAPWGLGERFDVAASLTRGTDYLRAGASLPVGLAGWRVGVNASTLRYRVLESQNITTGLAPEGTTQTVGAEAQYPLIRSPRARWTLSLGAEERHQTNRDDNVTVGLLEVSSRARSRSASIGINGWGFDEIGLGGQTLAGVQLVSGRLSLEGSPNALLAADARAENTQGDYQVLRWSLSRLQSLSPTLDLWASASGQFGSRNLNSGEKLYLGGMGAVNAYPSAEAAGSSGQLVNIELRQRLDAAWQIAGFYDWGQVRQYRNNARADGAGPLSARNTVTLEGIGASISWRGENGWRAKVTWAHRIGANPLMTTTGRDTDGSFDLNRIWLSAGYSF